MKNKSIYEILYESLTDDGDLPPDFRLAEKPDDPNEHNALKFAVGAEDGLFIYGIGNQYEQKVVNKVFKRIKAGKFDEIIPAMGQTRAIKIIDPLLEMIQDNIKEIDTGALYDYAEHLAFESDNEEAVKLGIAIIGLIAESLTADTIKKLFLLGMYDEFSLYVAVAIKSFEMGNDIILFIANNAQGWGKIHAVERLEPETEEIKDWILYEGCNNTILNNYLGLTCANKGDLIGALRKDDLDADQFDSICIVVGALLDEGPIDGIGNYEHTEEALLRFLQYAEEYASNLRHLNLVLNIEDILESLEITNKYELQEYCTDISRYHFWRGQIFEDIADCENEDFHHAKNAAEHLGIDVSSYVYEAVKKDPMNYHYYIDNAFRNPDYARSLTSIYEDILPLDELATGMGDYLHSPTHLFEDLCLVFVLQALRAYPLLGISLVKTGLLSPVTGTRHFAILTLKVWSETLEQPVEEYSPELFKVVKDVSVAEVNDENREMMLGLM